MENMTKGRRQKSRPTLSQEKLLVLAAIQSLQDCIVIASSLGLKQKPTSKLAKTATADGRPVLYHI